MKTSTRTKILNNCESLHGRNQIILTAEPNHTRPRATWLRVSYIEANIAKLEQMSIHQTWTARAQTTTNTNLASLAPQKLMSSEGTHEISHGSLSTQGRATTNLASPIVGAHHRETLTNINHFFCVFLRLFESPHGAQATSEKITLYSNGRSFLWEMNETTNQYANHTAQSCGVSRFAL